MSRRNRTNNTHQTEEVIAPMNGRINEFLWTCAGVNKNILRRCPGDHAKYAGIGGTILFTALMAMLSGGYAFYKVFADVDPLSNELDHRALILAIFFGIFWGSLIFNLDRFMVNTMYSDGTPKITKEELRGGLPRIILAVFLGIVISTPIEMRIFKDKIQTQLIIEQGKTDAKIDKEHQNLQKEIDNLNLEKARNDSIMMAKQDELTTIQQQGYEEIYGTGITKKAGLGPAAQQLKRKEAELTRQLQNLELQTKQKNEAIDIRLKPKLEELSNYNKQKQKAVKSERGFAAELKALYELTSPSESWTLFMSRMLIMFLFVAIEVIPTFFKMMMSAGPYDDIINAEKHKIRVLSQKQMSDVNDEVNTSVKISTMKNQKRIEAETLANQDILEKIARIQTSLLEEALELWRQEELVKIHENPSRYIIRRQDNLEKLNEPGEILSSSNVEMEEILAQAEEQEHTSPSQNEQTDIQDASSNNTPENDSNNEIENTTDVNNQNEDIPQPNNMSEETQTPQEGNDNQQSEN
jgi:hypothetical protein